MTGTWFGWNCVLLEFADRRPSKGSALSIFLFLLSQGLVLGIYSKEKADDVPQFTSAGENFDKLVSGKLRKTLNMQVFTDSSFLNIFFCALLLVDENAWKFSGQCLPSESESMCLWNAVWYSVFQNEWVCNSGKSGHFKQITVRD